MVNVLLTLGEDNVIRMWTETSSTEDIQFHICYASHVENPLCVHYLNTAHEVSPNDYIIRLQKEKFQKPYEAGHNDMDYDSDEDENLAEIGESPDTGLVESNTWLATVQRDGTLIIDIVQGLADMPRRTPKSSTWIMMVQIGIQFNFI